MNKQYIFPFIIFLLCFIALFFGGLAGSIYSGRGLFLSIILNKSMITEKGIISYVSKRSRALNYTVYFSLENQTTVYKQSEETLLCSAKAGDEINVVFNKERNFFIIKDHIIAIYFAYINAMILCLICFAMSFLCRKAVIELYRGMLNKDVCYEAEE